MNQRILHFWWIDDMPQRVEMDLVKKRIEQPRLHTMRMHRIARALVYDDRPVAEIASEFGFSGLGHFYRGFQEAFAETPAAWRRKR